MTLRRASAAVALSLLTLLTLLTLLAPTAAASPADLADRTRDWMESVLRVDIAPRPLVEADLTGCGGQDIIFGCDALSWPDRIAVSTRAWDALARAEERRRDPGGEGKVLIHELLHDGHAAGTPPAMEEGIVEALAQDLHSPWAKAMGMRRWVHDDVTTSCPYELAAVRKASALATGGSWRSRAARLWRRDLWAQDYRGRLAMWEAAWRQQ